MNNLKKIFLTITGLSFFIVALAQGAYSFPRLKRNERFAVQDIPSASDCQSITVSAGMDINKRGGRLYIGINNKIDTVGFDFLMGAVRYPNSYKLPKGKIWVKAESKGFLPFEDSIPINGHTALISIKMEPVEE